jgi:hypothetical protein
MPAASILLQDLAGARHEIRTRSDIEQDDAVAVLQNRDVAVGLQHVGALSGRFEQRDEFLTRHVGKREIERQHQMSVADRRDHLFAERDFGDRLRDHARQERQCRRHAKKASVSRRVNPFRFMVSSR